jgi:hypothetical protein
LSQECQHHIMLSIEQVMWKEYLHWHWL